jgi:hypothetical protein
MTLKESWLTKRKLAGFGPEVKPVYKTLQLENLVADASEEFVYIACHLVKLSESSVALMASLIPSGSTLGVKVATIASGGCKCFGGCIKRLRSSPILVAERVSASAVEMDGGNGCHGRKAKVRLSPRETTIIARAPVSRRQRESSHSVTINREA